MTVVSQPSICRCYDIMMCYVGFTECVFPPVFWQWGTLYPLMVKSSTQAWPRHIVNHPHWHKRPAGLATWFHIQGLLYVGHVYNQEKNILYLEWSPPWHVKTATLTSPSLCICQARVVINQTCPFYSGNFQRILEVTVQHEPEKSDSKKRGKIPSLKLT